MSATSCPVCGFELGSKPWRGPVRAFETCPSCATRVLPRAVIDELDRLVGDLAAGRFREIAADGRAGRMSAVELALALDEDRASLVPVPDEGLRRAQIYPLGGDGSVFAIELPMWTEAGPSPLELRLTATVKGDEAVALAIVEVLRSRA